MEIILLVKKFKYIWPGQTVTDLVTTMQPERDHYSYI